MSWAVSTQFRTGTLTGHRISHSELSVLPQARALCHSQAPNNSIAPACCLLHERHTPAIRYAIDVGGCRATAALIRHRRLPRCCNDGHKPLNCQGFFALRNEPSNFTIADARCLTAPKLPNYHVYI